MLVFVVDSLDGYFQRLCLQQLALGECKVSSSCRRLSLFGIKMDWLLFLAPVPDFINSRGSAGDTCRGSNLSYSIDLRHFHPAAAHNSLLWASLAERKQEGSRSSVRNRLGGSTVELY